MKKILIILDGASDLGHPALDGKTPLEAAETPNLDFFAENSKMGYMYPLEEGVVPGSDNSLISIFGNNPDLSKRGVLEAVGAGFELKRGDLALRTNFGTIENLKTRKVIDRRAGRTLSIKEAKILGEVLNEKIKLPVKFEFKPTIQHRGVLVLRGGFCDDITDIDSEHMFMGKSVLAGRNDKFKFSEALNDDEISKYTSNLLNNFAEQTFKILNNHHVNLERKKKGLYPANFLFIRGGGVWVPNLKKYKDWMSINSMPLEIGIAKLSWMKNFSFNYPELKGVDVYDVLYKGLNKSIEFAIRTIKKNHKNFAGCYIQFKETDVPGHDNKPLEKKNMIEIIDKKFFGFLREFVKKKDIKVVVTCDHSTPCRLKAHSSHPVPVLVYPGQDLSERFTEVESRVGDLGKLYGKEFMERTGLVEHTNP